MAKPISPTPILEGKEAIELLNDMERTERGGLTEKEKEFRKKVASLDSVVRF